MFQFNIVITFFTIVYGLMLTDLFASFHRLLRKKKIVKWHWLPLISAWFLFLIIIKNWWNLALIDKITQWKSFYFFLANGHLLILLYLLSSAALPDKVPENGIDLKQYYFQNHRYFWSLMAFVSILSVLIAEISQAILGRPLNIENIIANGIFLFLITILIITKKYWIHAVIVSLFVIFIILEIVNKM